MSDRTACALCGYRHPAGALITLMLAVSLKYPRSPRWPWRRRAILECPECHWRDSGWTVLGRHADELFLGPKTAS